MFAEKIRRSYIGKSGFQKSLLRKIIFLGPLKMLMLSSVDSVAPRGFFQVPRSV
jgi:hypothetical protein